MSAEETPTTQLSPSFAALTEKLFSKPSTSRTSLRSSSSLENNKILRAQQAMMQRDASALQRLEAKAKTEGASTLGKGWFDLKPIEMTEALKQDLKIISLRANLDPTRFYKNTDDFGPIVGIGTVVEGPTEYKSQRLTRRKRKQTILDEVLSDGQTKSFAKRKFAELQQQRAKTVRMYKLRKPKGHQRSASNPNSNKGLWKKRFKGLF